MRHPWNKRQKTVTVIEVDVRKLIKLSVLIVMGGLALFSLIRFGLRQIPVQSFEIQGTTEYEVGELRQIIGVSRGDKLYRMDLDEMEEQILSECFDIKEIKLRRSFPSKLVFEIVERKATWYLEISDDFYVLDEEMLVIEETGNEESLIRKGVTKLTLPNLSSAICGQFPVFGKASGRSEEENEREITKTCELLVHFQTSPLKQELTSLDLESRFAVHAVWRESYNIYFGDYKQMETKLELVWKQLLKNMDLYEGGEIDASYISSVTFGPFHGSEEITKPS